MVSRGFCKNIFLFILVVLLVHSDGFAQEIIDEDSTQLDMVYIIGKSLETLKEEEAFHVHSIAAKQFQNSSYSAKEILNKVSGVRIQEDGGLGSGLQLNLNGFSGDQVKVYLDGVPMSHFSSSLALSNIPANAIQRIDIYKGVVPIYLGGDALGGAINIITNKKRNFLDVSLGAGSFNTQLFSINGAYTHTSTGFTIRGSAHINHSDNNYKVWVPIVLNNSVSHYENVPRFHDQYRSGSIKLETGWVDKKYADQILISLLSAKDHKEVQHGATMASVYGGVEKESQSLIPALKYSKVNLFTTGLDVNLHSSINIGTSLIVDTLKGVRYNWLGEKSETPGSNEGEFARTHTQLNDWEWHAEANATYLFKEKHAFAANYFHSDYHRNSYDKEHPNKVENQFPKSLSKNILGLSYQYNLLSKWNALVFTKIYGIQASGSKLYDFGLPTQRTEEFYKHKSDLGYGLAASFFPTHSMQIKISYEHAFRMPTAIELFGDGLFIADNPDLGPEQSDNINLGLSYSFKLSQAHSLSLSGSLIYRDAKDLIYQVVKVASPITHFENLSKTRTYGLESSFKYSWKDFIHVGGNLTYQNITDQADFIYNQSYTNTGYQPNYQKGFRLPNTPYLFANILTGFNWTDIFLPHSTLQVNYRYNYVHEYFLSWAELGSKNTKKIIPTQSAHDIEMVYSFAKGKYNLGMECRNLMNARLYDQYYLQKPGRSFYLTARYFINHF